MFLRRLFPYGALRSCHSSLPLSVFSVHRRSFLHFEKTIIPGHLSWVKTIAYDFNSLFYCGIAVCYLLYVFFPGDQFTENPVCCLCCLLSPRLKVSVTFLCTYKVFRYPVPLLRIVPALTWEGRTCPVVSAAFLGPLLVQPGKKEGWQCILLAIGKKCQVKD